VSLLRAFSLISLGCMIVLGLVLGGLMEDKIRARAFASAQDQALILGRTIWQSRLQPTDLDRPLRAEVRRTLDQAGRQHLRDGGMLGVRVFDRELNMRYADERPPMIGKASDEEAIVRALRGKVSSIRTPLGGKQVLEVYAPLRFGDRVSPYGAVKVAFDFGPPSASARRDVVSLWGVLAGGLALLWLALYRVVAGASKILRRQADDNRHQARHDHLTGLANRVVLLEALETAVRQAKPGREAALLIVDLDRFKEVNDTFGHDHGDLVLIEAARRLSGVTEADDLVVRLGGDEFAILRPSVKTLREPEALASRVVAAMAEPVKVAGTAVVVDASVGVALSPRHAHDGGGLIKHAEVAMYAAKGSGNRSQVYDPARDPHRPERLELLAELPRAVRQNELVLHWQPEVRISDGTLCGAEALVRWAHPRKGRLAPGEFVPLVELSSLGNKFTLYVIEAALQQRRAWASMGLPLSVAVNLAGPNAVDQALPEQLRSVLARTGMPPGELTLEINEETVMSDLDRVGEVLAGLRRLGVRLALDDFGTGRTALGHLKNLPIDELKIDRAFVSRMDRDPADAAVVRSMVDLAHNLGLSVVAEGVETEAILTSLGEMGADIAQGYLFSPPIPPLELAAWAGREARPRRAA
jgi:diguanylate cyclase (GGDEF)-like protein